MIDLRLSPTTGHWIAATRVRDVGPRTRVVVTGTSRDEPTIRTALTRTWRHAGQPLTVIVSSRATPVDRIARAWADEHAIAGITVETRHVVLAACAGQVLALDEIPSTFESLRTPRR